MVGALLCAASMALPAHGQAPGPGFTYQGRLQQSGAPVNATADLQFRLFDALTGGAQVGGAQAVSNVSVVDGLFTATIDFGPGAFNGEPRWLEIDVRSPAGAGAFVTLAPRQALSATPYAGFAARPWETNGTHLTYDAGSVGITGTAPGIAALSVTKAWDGENGGVTLFGDKPTLRFSGGSAAGGEAWIAHVGSDGPGNLGFFRRTGPSAWDHVMSLTAQGDLRLGPAGQLSPAAASEPLRIVRGGANGSGLITNGSGFSVAHIGTGLYRVTFDSPFGHHPAVTTSALALPQIAEPAIGLIGTLNGGTSVTLEFRRSTDGTPVDTPFRFIAVGSR